MSKIASKSNEIFAAREPLTPSDETARALEDVRANPDDPEKYMQLGLCLRRQMFFREAVEAYSEGLTCAPFHCLLYRHRGHAYLNLGLYAQAAADFEMGLRIDPRNWDCLYHLGVVYHLMRRYKRAVEVLERCYALSPSDEFRICTADWLCMTLMRMGKLDEMREVAGRIRPDMVAGGSEGYFERVLVYNGSRDAGEVLAEAEALDDHGFATGAYGLAVYFECVTGERDKAKRILEEIAKRDETWGGFAEHAAAERLRELREAEERG